MSATSSCPDHRAFERLGFGQLPVEEVELIAEHLEQCSRCVGLVQILRVEDPLVAALRAQADAAEKPERNLVDNLIKRLKDLQPSASDLHTVASPTGQKSSTPPPEASTHDLQEFLAPAQQPDEIGRLGPYRVLKVLGAGGMGVVFLAEDPQLQRRVALKAMKPTRAESSADRQRFLREARAAAAVTHDHIVTIHQVGEDRGLPFLAMQFLQGETLNDRIKREGRMPVYEILRIGREIAEGLTAAHEHGLIHRDIKPANIWLEKVGGRVKIVDFGLARSAQPELRPAQPAPNSGASNLKDDAHLTQEGFVVGTPAYMAPEQARGEALDPRCDLFSLGSVLYRLCTGEVPFKGETTMATLIALANDRPKPPQHLNPNVPTELADLILRLLAKDRTDRPLSARVVAHRLLEIEDTLAAQAGPTYYPGGTTLPETPWPAAVATPTPPPAALRPPARSADRSSAEGDASPAVPTGLLRFYTLAGLSYLFGKSKVVDPSTLPASDGTRVPTLPGEQRVPPGAVPGGNHPGRRRRPPQPPGVRPREPEPDNEPREAEDARPASASRSRWHLLVVLLALLLGLGGGTWFAPTIIRYFANQGQFVLQGPDAALLADVKVAVIRQDGKTIATLDAKTRPKEDLATGTYALKLLSGREGLWLANDTLELKRGGQQAVEVRYDPLADEHSFKVHAGPVQDLAYSPDGRYLLTCSSTDRVVRLWEVARPAPPVRRFEGHTESGVQCVTFSPDGNRGASGGTDKTARVWNLTTGEQEHNFSDHDGTVLSVAFSPDNQRVLTGCQDGCLRVWDLEGGQLYRRFETPDKSPVTSVAFSPDGFLALAGCQDGTISIWHIVNKENRDTRKVPDHQPVTRLTFAPDSPTFLAASGEITLWDVNSPGQPLRRFGGPVTDRQSAAFSPNGRFVLAGSEGPVQVWDVSTGKENGRFTEPKGKVGGVAFYPKDGRRVVAGGEEGVVWFQRWPTVDIAEGEK